MKKSGSQSHEHHAKCGHTAIKHGDHIDYLQDGQLHHPEQGCNKEHVLEITATNPNECRPLNPGCTPGHAHGPGCGHEKVPHGDHFDYLVDGRLHHVHGDHCDDHGPVEVVKGH